ncbi:hypothetical protein OPV22_032916 [Ensete ventricosum]|uniref:Uncharacterized protein n=1 Tax=Ensete ventricosum TaxID=4639 RepID=A0AAV8PYM8_ENSVE|nr:hypothetical protein OPV22_032916 [Ensete ventricosum]
MFCRRGSSLKVWKFFLFPLVFQVQLRQPIFFGKGARVVGITLDQVYMPKIEGIGFRFLPDPLQTKNDLAKLHHMYGFVGAVRLSGQEKEQAVLLLPYTSRRYNVFFYDSDQNFLHSIWTKRIPSIVSSL